MTNEEFLQYKQLVHKVCTKYKNNKFVEYDDLFQIGSIALMLSFDKFTSEKEKQISLLAYLYNNIEWAILRELKKYERIEAFTTVSIHHETGEDTTIEDILQDISIDIEAKIIDKLVLEEYIKEFNKYLDSIELDVLYMKVFDEMSYKAIERNLRLSDNEASKIFKKAKRKLLNKSNYIRERYLSYMNSYTNIYNNPLKIVLSRDIG